MTRRRSWAPMAPSCRRGGRQRRPRSRRLLLAPARALLSASPGLPVGSRPIIIGRTIPRRGDEMEGGEPLTPWYVLVTANVAGGGEKYQRPREVGTVPTTSIPFVASFAASSQDFAVRRCRVRRQTEKGEWRLEGEGRTRMFTQRDTQRETQIDREK